MEHYDNFGIDRRIVNDIRYREANLALDIKELLTVAYLAIEELHKQGGSPYLKALEHCLTHVANGGTINTFKPLVRTTEYAGLDRRQSQSENAVH